MYNHTQSISILIASYNTPRQYLEECLHSIQRQEGLGISYKIELVWINDGSLPEFSQALENLLKTLEEQYTTTSGEESVIKIKYVPMDSNKGLSYCLHHGVLLCSYELIFRMDSDDIMHETRIQKQLKFMNQNPECVLSGTNIVSFTKKNTCKMVSVERSYHLPILTWEKYKETKKGWILNHPTLCFRKYAVISVGNYNEALKDPFEDLELELKILKKYGFVCNLSEILLYYRIHENQITWIQRNKSRENNEKKQRMIEELINHF